jgi:hypothetical protein
MESVEGVTDKIPVPMPADSSNFVDREEEETAPADEDTVESSEPKTTQDVWLDVISTGLSLLDNLSRVVKNEKADVGGKGDASPLHSIVERDPRTGRNYLKLPIPGPELLNKFADLLKSLSNR